MTRTHATVVALLLLLAGGLLHGLCAERWTPSPLLEEAVARVAQVPLEIGDWQGKAESDDVESFDMAGARGYWTRIYTHRRSGTRVLVILMCGRPGRMAVHTPEVCYRGAGYDMPDDATRQPLETGGAFWTAIFSKPADMNSGLRLFWAWSTDGTWEAPANPRWQFRGQPFLYKLYVAHDLAGADAGPAGDAGAEFLRPLLPALQQALFPAGS